MSITSPVPDSVVVADEDDDADSGETGPIVIALPRMSITDIKRLERVAMKIDQQSYLWMLDSGKTEPTVFRKTKTIPEGFSEDAVVLSGKDLTDEVLGTVVHTSGQIPEDQMKFMKLILRDSLKQILTPTD